MVRRQGRRTGDWNTIAASSKRPRTSRPRASTLPDVGRTRPVRIRSVVDFPQPLGPTIERNSFSPTSNDSRSMTVRASKVWVSSSTLTAAGVARVMPGRIVSARAAK